MNHKSEDIDKESKLAHKYSTLFNLCHMMSYERDLNTLLDFLVKNSAEVVDADRASIFLFDKKRNELWSKVAIGTTVVIRFDARLGIAGEVLKTGEIINAEDAYSHPKFNREVDKKTGYTTNTLLCVPMKDINGKPIGVLQTLNKKGGMFSKEDEEVLEVFASHAAIAVENAKLIGELGTGKELAARTIHYNSSRFERPFIEINCAALPESLLEGELFGIEKGVATGV